MPNSLNAMLAAVETKLAAITTAGGYNYTVGDTGPGGKVPEEIAGGRPSYRITSASEERLRMSPSTYRSRVTLEVNGIASVEGTPSYIREKGCKMAADIEKALTVDPTLSSTAHNVMVLGSDLTFDLEGARAVSTVRFLVDLTWAEATP